MYANEGRKTASVKWTTPAAHDGQGKNCGRCVWTWDVFDIGLTTFVYRATDDSGLSSFCYITFEVKVHTCSVPVVAHADRVCNSTDFIFGTTCQFTCNSGYDINGASQLKCEEGGAWCHQAPRCTPKTCPDLDTFSCTDTYNYGSLCSLTCNVTAGHAVTLPRSTFCLQNGSWHLPIPSCRDTAPPKISNCPMENIVAYAVSAVAMTTVTWDDVLGTDNSGNVSVTQTAGPLSGSPFPVGKTDVNYKAVDSSGNEAECEFSVLINYQICPTPPYNDPRLRYDCSNQYDLGSRCDVSCTDDYVLDGSSSIQCQTNAALLPRMSWALSTGSSPSCHKPKCQPLKSPTNGFLTCDHHQTAGDICTMTCDDDWDRPRNAQFDLFACSPSSGIWQPTSLVPDCTVKRIPGEMRLLASMRFYTSSCGNAAGKHQLQGTFLPLINSTTFFSSTTCATSSSCSIEDVSVECLAVNRRKRSITDRELDVPRGRHKRSETALVVRWHFSVTYSCASMTTDDCVTHHENVLHELRDKVQVMLDSGSFNTTVVGVHVRSDSFNYNYAHFKCGEGMLPVLETGSCAVCPTGTMFNSTTTSCDPCSKGTYQNEDHSFTCKTCPSGTSTLDKGSRSSTDCKVQCLAGQASPNGIEPCVVCPIGEYQPSAGTRHCLPCPRGTMTTITGSTHREACTSFEFSSQGDVQLTSIAPTSSDILDFTLSVWYKATNLTKGTTISAGGTAFVLLIKQPMTISLNGVQMITAGTYLNRWTRLDVTFHSSTQNLTLYRDGQTVSVSVASQAPVIASSSTLSLNVGSSDAISVRSMALYKTCKTAAQILAMASTCDTMEDDNIVLSVDHMSKGGPGSITMKSPSSCKAVEECLASPCNGHPCLDTPTSYVCQCQSGYTGRTCASPPDFCEHHQCENMALCRSGGSNYTCECTQGFRGPLCQQRIVDGGWSTWTGWSACSVTCGGGLRTRSRSCDSPLPDAEGTDCPGPATATLTCNTLNCLVCSSSQLQLGYGNIVSGPECNGTAGALDCRPVCIEGFFTPRHQITVYTCREGHWSPATRLPSCIRVISPTSMSLTAQVNYTGETCLTPSHSEDLKISLTQNLGRVECGRKSTCSISVAFPGCSPEGITTTYSLFTVNLTNSDLDLNLDLPSYIHNKTLSPGLAAVVDAVETLEQTARQLQNTSTSVWTVTSNSVTYSPSYPINVTADVICPRGTFPEDGLCGECPAGTFYSDIRSTCVLCARGTYQSTPGQSQCRECPPGRTTPYSGSTSAEECTHTTDTTLVPKGSHVESSTLVFTTKQDVPSSNNNVLIIVASVLGAVVLAALIVIVVLIRRRKKKPTNTGSNEGVYEEGYRWEKGDEYLSPLTQENVYHEIPVPDNVPGKTPYYYHVGGEKYVPCDPDQEPDPDDLPKSQLQEQPKDAPEADQDSQRVDGRAMPSYLPNTAEFTLFLEERVTSNHDTIDPYYQ
ncbi:sushi, von Willebrand factor type A, EGF and pentraxin domain-containing protein 1-like [Haliotis rufescens]|uniref:sushi, von Willebrand factor type A, EGF and pentraxin domain-containing protein 1-like n=1 Tax=Haliotis rufescens TaxID=6454 RepID=UPI00201F2DE1|nr:sushi, von Willebrand factor type A, EGF and pentraxin domain-containing protein 1-like [Haliotis rufescens]